MMETTKIDHGAVVGLQHGVDRSPHWPSVEKAFKAKYPDCLYCGPGSGAKYGIQVHHIHPFHQVVGVGRADLELDFRNLTPLCETEKDKPAPDHHITCGHLGSFQRNNENVVSDVDKWFNQPQKLIESTAVWLHEKQDADPPFSQWTRETKQAYRTRLDKELPPDPALLAQFFPHGLPTVDLTA